MADVKELEIELEKMDSQIQTMKASKERQIQRKISDILDEPSVFD